MIEMGDTVPEGESKGEETLCPVCDGSEIEVWRSVFDDRYGHPGSFQLARCRQCGHLMTLPRLREQDLPQLYGSYYPRKALTPQMVSDQVAQALAPFARLRRWWMGGDNQGEYHAQAGEKMLDIGCGSGASLLVARQLGAQAYGVEADPNVQQLARELDLRIHQGSIHDYPFPGKIFDLVILNQVIEHIPEPGKALQAIVDRLSPQGRIILTFPNRDSLWCRLFGARWINWHVPYHLHHFNKSGFEQLAARYGLQVVRAHTITPNLWTYLQFRARRGKLTQGVPSPIWRVHGVAEGGPVPLYQRRLRRRLRMMLMTIVLGAFGVLNRCVDMVGQGDCLMVELRRRQDK